VKNPGVYEIELGLSVYEFMNSDEYSGNELWPPIESISTGGSSVPILPQQI
jgi:NADH-quinone oxidoreductase subunit F